MTLAQLGAEYLEQEKVIRGRISDLRSTMEGCRGGKMLDLSRRVSSLYAMALDAHETGIYLLNYYREGEENAKRA